MTHRFKRQPVANENPHLVCPHCERSLRLLQSYEGLLDAMREEIAAIRLSRDHGVQIQETLTELRLAVAAIRHLGTGV